MQRHLVVSDFVVIFHSISFDYVQQYQLMRFANIFVYTMQVTACNILAVAISKADDEQM